MLMRMMTSAVRTSLPSSRDPLWLSLESVPPCHRCTFTLQGEEARGLFALSVVLPVLWLSRLHLVGRVANR